MKTPRIIAGAASIAVASSILMAAPASAADPTPVQLGNFGGIGLASDGESLEMGSYVLFAGSGEAGTELWRTATTPATTTVVKDIYAGSSGSAPRLLTRAGSSAFFVASTSDHGRELWKTNGTAAGTVEVDQLVAGTDGPGIDEIEAIGNKVVFSADVDANGGEELWISDGTAAGTNLLKDINPTGDSSPSGMTLHGGAVYFAANNGTHGRELWKTDGTPGGTVMVDDLQPGATGSNPGDLTDGGATLFFSAVDEDGRELFRSQGIAASTYKLKDINPGAENSNPKRFTAVGGTTFFVATDPVRGDELWKTDGTLAGTLLVKDIRPGAAGSTPNELAATGGSIVFRAASSEGDTELWTSNGTDAGTRLVKDIRPGAAGSSPQNFMVNPGSGRVLFTADNGVTGDELWLTNGTTDGTALVADVIPGSTSSSPALVGTTGTSTVFRTVVPGGSTLWAMHTSGLDVVESGTPTMTGNPVVGGTLTADAGAWEVGTSFSYAWLRDGASIPGATATTYQPTAADLGRQVSVRVTGSKPANISLSKTTASVGIGAAAQAPGATPSTGTQTRRPTPSIAGTAKVGKTLKLKKKSYDAGVSKSYQWLRNGKAIKGGAAKKSSYKLKSSDKGKRIQVRVTASKAGFDTVVLTSKKTSKIKKK